MTFARKLAEYRERRAAESARIRGGIRASVPPLVKGCYAPVSDSAVAVPKDAPVHHDGYRRLVAQQPCRICGIVGYGQAAHPNTGKGMGTKTDDRLCFSLCGPRPGDIGCHARFDQGALFTKAERRLLEPAWGADTRRTIAAAGLWPKNLPTWSEA